MHVASWLACSASELPPVVGVCRPPPRQQEFKRLTVSLSEPVLTDAGRISERPSLPPSLPRSSPAHPITPPSNRPPILAFNAICSGGGGGEG